MKEKQESEVKNKKVKKQSKKTGRKVFKIIILIAILVVLIGLCVLGVFKLIKNKYKKILLNNDSSNYEIIQIVDGTEEQTSKLRNNTLVIDDGENIIWISKNANKSIIMNTNKKTAIITSESDIKIATLNESFIKEYFENSDNKFKYLGKENNYALLEFTNKNTGIITILYLNLDTNIIDKQIVKNDIAQNEIEYKVKLNSVSKDEIMEPDLTDYYIIEQ